MVEHQAAQLPGRCPPGPGPDVPAAGTHGEGQAGLVGRGVGADVGAPGAVALLQSQALDRAVAARRGTRCGQQRPQHRAVLRRAVQLPAQLAHVRDAQGPDRHVADDDLPHGGVREGQVRCGQRGQQRARVRAPQPEARPRARDVGDVDVERARVPPQPAQVVRTERRARHHDVGAGGDARDRHVHLDAAALVERLGVDDRAGRPVEVAREHVCAEPGGVGSRDLDLRERRLVEQPRGAPHGDVLGLDAR